MRSTTQQEMTRADREAFINAAKACLNQGVPIWGFLPLHFWTFVDESNDKPPDQAGERQLIDAGSHST
jgi:hypothetical protein